jgi:hypothetical protein
MHDLWQDLQGSTMNWRRLRDEYFNLADGYPPEWRSPNCYAYVLPGGGMIGDFDLIRLELNGWQK